MRLLYRALWCEWYWRVIICGGSLVVGAWLIVHYLPQAVLVGVGVGAIVIGLLGWYRAYELYPPRHPLWRLLGTQSRRIVWVYGVDTHYMPFGLQTWRMGLMYFHLDDGTEWSVQLPATKLRMVSRFLNRMLPHATFGYTPQRAVRYAARPEALRRLADE